MTLVIYSVNNNLCAVSVSPKDMGDWAHVSDSPGYLCVHCACLGLPWGQKGKYIYFCSTCMLFTVIVIFYLSFLSGVAHIQSSEASTETRSASVSTAGLITLYTVNQVLFVRVLVTLLFARRCICKVMNIVKFGIKQSVKHIKWQLAKS